MSVEHEIGSAIVMLDKTSLDKSECDHNGYEPSKPVIVVCN